MVYGKHVKVQLYGADRSLLGSKKVAGEFLVMITAVASKPFGEPFVYEIEKWVREAGLKPAEDEREGIIGTMLSRCSYAGLRTYPPAGYAVVDLFCSRYFEAKGPEAVAYGIYSPRRVEMTDLSYSLNYPVNPGRRLGD